MVHSKPLHESLRSYVEVLVYDNPIANQGSISRFREAADEIERLQALLNRASAFTVQEPDRRTGQREIRVERCLQPDASYLWAVRSMGSCFAKDGEWEHEPLPSNRDDEFYDHCRYETMTLAFEAAQKAICRIEK